MITRKARLFGVVFLCELFLTVLAALAAVPFACSARQRDSSPLQEDKWNYDAMRRVPLRERTKMNPRATNPDGVAAGGKLFEEHCAECHGLKAEGGKRAPSLLRVEVTDASPGALYWILTNGVIWRGMPDWSKLPEAQRWQIVDFLKSFNAPAAR